MRRWVGGRSPLLATAQPAARVPASPRCHPMPPCRDVSPARKGSCGVGCCFLPFTEAPAPHCPTPGSSHGLLGPCMGAGQRWVPAPGARGRGLGSGQGGVGARLGWEESGQGVMPEQGWPSAGRCRAMPGDASPRPQPKL